MRITITTDDGELVSMWKDSDDDDRRYMQLGEIHRNHRLDSEWAKDLAHDMGAARTRDGRDSLTGEKR